MSYSPVPTPPPSGAGSSVLPPRDPAAETQSTKLAEEVLSSLRQKIASGNCDLESVAGWIAQGAHAATGASAAAIAMRREGVVVCMGRSGELAPELGAKLSVDSGLSGECLRTGKILRCDDTQKDYRADPEVCRRLGLHSIAAVPLRGRHGIMGVLEAFSTRSYAFAEEDMQVLRELAELAETARANLLSPVAWHGAVPAAAGDTPALGNVEIAAEASRQDSISPLTWLRRVKLDEPRYWIATSAVAVLLLAGVAWRLWHTSSASVAPTAVQAATTQPAATPTDSPVPAQTVIEWKPSPVRLPQARQRATNSSPDTDDVVTRAVDRQQEPSAAAEGAPSNDIGASDRAPKMQQVAPVEAPTIVARATDTSLLGTVLSGDTALPKLSTTHISSGLSGGTLLRKVNPVYPEQALSFRLQGPVVMQATVTENGAVEDLKVISGQPILAGAATSAVRQWKYRPFMLNGKPIRMKTQITITFKAP